MQRSGAAGVRGGFDSRRARPPVGLSIFCWKNVLVMVVVVAVVVLVGVVVVVKVVVVIVE